MHQDVCGGRSGLCEGMRPTKGSELLKYLRNVKFRGLSGDEFNLDSNGFFFVSLLPTPPFVNGYLLTENC